MKKTSLIKIIAFFITLIFLQKLEGQQPVSWWKFDAINNNKLIDDISEVKDTLIGYRQLVNGVKGSSLKLDGYTTRVVRKSNGVPEFIDGLAIESWIALQALPWNWSAIVSQGGNVIQKVKKKPAYIDLGNLSKGLTGVQFGNADLTDPLGKQELLSTDNDWTGSMNNWSDRWRGYIEAPYTGEIHFRTEADNGLQLLIDNNKIIDGWEVDGPRTGSFSMIKGQKYPVILTYGNDRGKAILRLFWSWQTQKEILIPIDAFGYSEQDDHLATEDIIPPKPSEPEYEHKIFFGVDAYGHLGFKLNINGKLYECVSEEKLPLLKWSHVAATFDAHEGMKIFINGELTAELVVQGTITPGEGSDLLLGMNIQKMGPVGSERQASAEILSNMVIYGLLDEVKIYDLPLTENHIRQSYEAESPDEIQPLAWDPMPSGPSEAVSFGAYSTRLKYTPEWDNPWPVSEVADVVVRFGKEEPRFVFWRGTSYIPSWATYEGAWFTNEFFERRGGPVSGTVSMVEPMSDKQTRYSNVRIIENNDARVIVHWRYAPTDLEYSMAFLDEETNWGDWADEYYILYPDAISIRKATLYTSALNEWIEYQESIVINQPGTSPDDNLNDNALTFLNLKGDSKTYTWTEIGGPKLEDIPEQFCIQKVNLKSGYKPFTIVNSENAEVRSYGGHAPGSRFNFWDHWPVSYVKSHTRVATSAERPSHTSLSHIRWNPYSETDNSRTWIMMHGMTNWDDDHLVKLAASWMHPAMLRLIDGNFIDEGYDKSQRAYVLNAADGAGALNFELMADENSPIVNPAFLIKNWGGSDVNLKINDQVIEQGDNFRSGHITHENGTDLIVWLKLKSDESVKILFYKPISRRRELK